MTHGTYKHRGGDKDLIAKYNFLWDQNIYSMLTVHPAAYSSDFPLVFHIIFNLQFLRELRVVINISKKYY